VIRRRRSGDGAAADPAATTTGLPALCPVARCSRCGYEFTPYTVSAVCPRCLEPFLRDPCYGGCFSCPLLPEPADEAR
jgi:predicted amidophosphoribosyltransferase